MPIAFACPRCKKTFEVDDALAGKKARCKQCRAVLLIPSAGSAEDALNSLREPGATSRREPASPAPPRLERAPYEPPKSRAASGSKKRKRRWKPTWEWPSQLDPAKIVGLVVFGGTLIALAVAFFWKAGEPGGGGARATTMGLVGLIWLSWGVVWTLLAFLDNIELSLFVFFRLPFHIVLTWFEEFRAFVLVAIGGYLVYSTGILSHLPEGPRFRGDFPVARDPAPRPRPRWGGWVPDNPKQGVPVASERWVPSSSNGPTLKPGPELPALPSADGYTDQYDPNLLSNVGDERKREGDARFRREIAPAGAVLVGFRVGYFGGFGESKVGSIQPVYRLGDQLLVGKRFGNAQGEQVEIVAKPGYAVGAVRMHAGLIIDGFDAVFMRVENGRLDPQDTEISPWAGDPIGGNPRKVATDGRVAVGVNLIVNDRDIETLGLVVLPQ